MKKIIAGLLIHMCFTQPLAAQTLVSNNSENTPYLQVYLDGIPDWQDYMKVKVWYVDYVRDRQLADIHVLITTQSTASGGNLYTIYFIGYGKFIGKTDTLHYTSSIENTNRKSRDELINTLSIGLLPYLAENGQQEFISINYLNNEKTAIQSKDKYNYWVYTTQLNGNLTGDQTTDIFDGSASFSAARITDTWKERFTADISESNNRFQTPTYSYKGNTIIKNLHALLVYSLNNHWSLGFEPAYYASTYSNIKSQFSAAPGIEYNIFPYNESVEHLFTFKYRFQPLFNFYTDSTLYNKTQELLLNSIFDVTLTQIKPWGNMSGTFTAANFLNHPKAFRLDFVGSMNIKLATGLFFNVSGNVSLINNQLSIAKIALTPEQIVLHQKEILSNYSYGVNIGITYVFGARFNNVVNPRYEGGVTIDPEIINATAGGEAPD
ncbi:MAG: hypothetical protein IPL12_17650 [Bacteroidetes bacterium]|nr:hypothetical protein [Bacteroidota bacterium]MBK8344942.1 hypothetical protein [Bacteroidota bacterium]